MKTIQYLFFIILLFPLSSYSQTKKFEGEVIISLTNKSKTTKYNIAIKEYKLKIDFYSTNQNKLRSLIINLETNEIFELNNLHKNFRRVNPKSFEYISLPKYSLIEDVKAIEKILNYPCEKWTLTESLNKNITIYRMAKDDKFIYLKKTFRYLNVSNNTFKFIDFFFR